MNTAEQDAILAAEYVLGLVDADVRRQLDKRVNDDATFAGQVLHWQKAFSGADVTTQDVTPPLLIWQNIEQEVGLKHRSSVAHLRPATWLGWALAAALAGVLVFTYVMKPESPSTLQPIAVLNSTQPGQQFVVSLDKSASVIQVSALNVTLPEAKSLQLWLIKGSAPPRSLGLITDARRSEFHLASEQLDQQTILAISLEPSGGSKLAGPSGPVLFQGKVTSL